jgi:1-acyl-sn-glycerol-3-phosphate acyltransferase
MNAPAAARARWERLRFLAGCAAGGIGLLGCSAIALVRALLVPRADNVGFFCRIFCRPLVRALGWDIALEGRELLERVGPCVVIANHQSALDVVIYGAIAPPKSLAIGKRSIVWIPLFGWLFAAAGCILVKREDPRSAQSALDRAIEAIRRRSAAVWITPEAHRDHGGPLLPFKTGAFRLAAAAGVPVIALVAAPLTAIVEADRRLARPGTLRIRVLQPIPVPAEAPREALAALAESTRERMQAVHDEMARGAPPPRISRDR